VAFLSSYEGGRGEQGRIQWGGMTRELKGEADFWRWPGWSGRNEISKFFKEKVKVEGERGEKKRGEKGDNGRYHSP